MSFVILTVMQSSSIIYFFFYCLCTKLIIHFSHIDISELQIRGGTEDNLNMIFLISEEKLVL